MDNGTNELIKFWQHLQTDELRERYEISSYSMSLLPPTEMGW